MSGDPVHLYLAKIGRRGGAAGTGKAKRRGGSAYYRSIVAKRKDRQRQAAPAEQEKR
jgi:hypothetical protein